MQVQFAVTYTYRSHNYHFGTHLPFPGFPMKNRARLPFRAGFTLVEMLIAICAASVVFLGVFSIEDSANILAAKCFAINITGTQARVSLDKIQMFLQESYSTPVPISDNGAALPSTLSITGTAATAMGYAPVISGTGVTITGTGAGIKFNRVIGGPFLVTVPSAGISATAGSISFTMSTAAQLPSAAPLPNDILSIYTTAVLSGTSNQVTATIGSITGAATSGNLVTYTATLSTPIESGTTTTGISQQKDSQGNVVYPSAVLLRPTAFVLVYPTTSITSPPLTPQLRYIDSYVTVSGSSGNVDVTKYTSVVTNEIEPVVSPTGQVDANPTGFAIVSDGSRPFVSLIIHTRSQNYDQFLLNKQSTDFATYMGVGSMISLRSVPY
jgi:prepilin-type N-terminal cleavage/methylation domain-containing protein